MYTEITHWKTEEYMNRNVAIVVTIFTVLCCGLPGIGSICFAALGLFGANLPDFYDQNPTATQEQVWLGAGIFIFVGLILLVIPVLTAIFTFRYSKQDDPTAIETIDYIPPAS